ncbi:hypothetical protein PVAP13_9NG773977 [Panicum virgatum]|uniref:Uncharacterized protein n=1 Tax=Panicum virgatum TaxID=38727 RepID=A0A8T0N495_PANVG|nr:hypothetical protein PVAP13_9NG773977 [Panicum virgatum]
MKGGGGGGALVNMQLAGGKQQAPQPKAASLFLYILLLYILLPVLVLYVVALAVSPFYSHPCPPDDSATSPPPPEGASDAEPTGLRHIVFGIGASSSLWASRREYIRVWWRPGEMRGFVWLDKPVPEEAYSTGLPGIRISGNTSGARWFVMGDDDTVFFPDNLVDAVSRYDHTQPYYVGNPSESHMAAEQLARMQDGCIQRYPALYGSDDRVHACMSELGVPLTRHPGFHQCDLWGDVLGPLGAHPVAPLVSLLSPREMETPMRTFLNWYRRADYTARPVGRDSGAAACQRPQVYYMRQARLDRRRNTTVTEYERHRVPPTPCRWRIPDPAALLDRVVVLKKLDPGLWKRAPRRNCCRVVSSPTKGKNRRMAIDVGVCREGEFARF